MPQPTTRVVIGIGANEGDRLATLREAVRRIDALIPVVAVSRVWETQPVGGPPQSDYLNAAVRVDGSGTPADLLHLLSHLARIEIELGRVRTVRDGPRTIDLDILWALGRIVDEPTLIVPHPRLHERAFAVAPLLDVAPDAVDPRSGAPYVVPSDQGIRVHSMDLFP